MAQRTLLKIVQDILSSMDSDEVNSITDTTEAQSVVALVETVFYDIVDRAELPDQQNVFRLTASGDSTKPVLMFKPTEYKNINWIKYNVIRSGETDRNYRLLNYVSPEEFLQRSHMLKESDADTDVMDHTFGTSSIDILYKNNEAPSYYTSFDDSSLVFNSYDSAVDSTLQAAKTMCAGERSRTFDRTDIFVAPLSSKEHNLLYNESKAWAWAELKQTAHQKAERSARRGWVDLQTSKRGIPTRLSEHNRWKGYGKK